MITATMTPGIPAAMIPLTMGWEQEARIHHRKPEDMMMATGHQEITTRITVLIMRADRISRRIIIDREYGFLY